MNQSRFLSTGEFAKIMNTTKETLFHYDEIGLFKPDHIGKNGYRYYSIQQTDTLDMILMLKDFGVPLSDIKKNLYNPDAKGLLQIYENEKNTVEQKIKTWQAKLFWIESQKKQLEYLLNIKENTVLLTNQPKRYYFIEHSASGSSRDIEKKFGLLTEKYYNLDSPFGYNLSYGRTRQELEIQNYTTYHNVMLFLNQKPASKDHNILPAGKYLSIYFCGNLDMLKSAYKKLNTYAHEKGLTLSSDYYEFFYANKISLISEKDFYTEITVQVLS